ncbi:MAG: hypothetical protein R3242_00195 [Akkermansiaceae bacterium]|nr:hypothetical protein [Akkermansiaceae bacterium]
MDLVREFTNRDGSLKAELYTDGAHPTPVGDQVMAQALVQEIERLVELGPIGAAE